MFDMDPGEHGRRGKKERRWFNSHVFKRCDEEYIDSLIGTLRNVGGLV